MVMKNKMKYKTVEMRLLNKQFYIDYEITKYPQILQEKDGRGYGIFFLPLIIGYCEEQTLIFTPDEMFIYSEEKRIDIFQEYNFAIPLHSNIKHGFKLKSIYEEEGTRFSGLDYNKAVIVKPEYIDRKYQMKDRAEFNLINSNKKIIEEEFLKFLNNYILAIKENNINLLDREYKHTTLQYFHDELYLNIK